MKSQLKEQQEERKAMQGKLEGLANREATKLVMRTPSAGCFTIDGNTIIRSSGGGDWKMVLLDVVAGEGVFSFRTRVHNKKGIMWIGVTDRVTQKESDWAQHEHSIQYGCSAGIIYYATGNGKS